MFVRYLTLVVVRYDPTTHLSLD